jgi:hypothetical protein
VLIRTDPAGKVNIISSSPFLLRAYLYDFDIDGDELKSEHTSFLEKQVVEEIRKNQDKKWRIFLDGTTSVTGDSDHNVDLSGRREKRVEFYLKAKLAGVPGEIVAYDAVWTGETHASAAGKPKTSEDEMDRAVQIALQLAWSPAPPPIARPAKPNPLKGAKSGFVVSQFFDVRYDGGSSVSVPGLYVTPGMEVHSFTIWDRVNGNGARFRYVGAAGGFGPKAVPPLSVTSAGDYVSFTTTKPVGLSQFAGAAAMSSGAADALTLLTFSNLPGDITHLPLPIVLKPGITLGMGVAAGIGKMFYLSAVSKK